MIDCEGTALLRTTSLWVGSSDKTGQAK